MHVGEASHTHVCWVGVCSGQGPVIALWVTSLMENPVHSIPGLLGNILNLGL